MMTRCEAKRRNRAAAEWAASVPDLAVAAVLQHPAAVTWREGDNADTAAAAAMLTAPAADTEAVDHFAGDDAFRNVDRALLTAAVADARRRVRSAMLEWANKTGDESRGGLSVLADARESVQSADGRPVRELPRFNRVEVAGAASLPGFEVDGGDGDPVPPVINAVLPGFEGVSPSVPSWLLAVYDQAGGATEARGRGAPWLLRLFVGALLSVAPELRTGRPVSLQLTTGQLARWLLPGGWDRRPEAFDRLRAALRGLDGLRVPVGIPGTSGGLLRVVDALLVPAAYDRGRGPVVLRVSIPPAAARGARVDWDRLTRYGAESAPVYRAYLSTMAVLDYAGRAGRALTPTIPAPEVDARGRKRRRKGGIVMRSNTARIPNPAARFVGWLSDDDVRCMVGLVADHRQNRARARDAIERLAGDGVLTIERRADGMIRLFAPDDDAIRGRG